MKQDWILALLMLTILTAVFIVPSNVDINETAYKPITGDLNGDGIVNVEDLSILLSHWSKPLQLNLQQAVNSGGLVIDN